MAVPTHGTKTGKEHEDCIDIYYSLYFIVFMRLPSEFINISSDKVTLYINYPKQVNLYGLCKDYTKFASNIEKKT